jgi:hypothetical protein
MISMANGSPSDLLIILNAVFDLAIEGTTISISDGQFFAKHI